MIPSDSTSILAHFSLLEDPRRNDWNTLHPLSNIVTIALCAVISGAEGWHDIAIFGKAKEPWFSQRLKLEHGIPSADTFRRVISSIDPAVFAECFLSWVNAVVGKLGGGVVAIDGKTLRGSYDKDDPKAALHLVSAWADSANMILAQYKVDQKTNEITAIPTLLKVLDLEGCLVTIDAMGCQHEIAQQIVDQKADYVLSLKGNQGLLHRDVKDYFAEVKQGGSERKGLSFSETVNLDHGRKEVRRCWVSDDVTWVSGYGKWAGLCLIAMIEYVRDVYTESRVERRYYISSRALTASGLMEAVRQHWGIENKVHWVLDVSFSEDASRIRRDDGAENFSTLRRMAINLLRRDETSKRKNIKGRRKRAGWDNQYLEQLLGMPNL